LSLPFLAREIITMAVVHQILMITLMLGVAWAYTNLDVDSDIGTDFDIDSEIDSDVGIDSRGGRHRRGGGGGSFKPGRILRSEIGLLEFPLNLEYLEAEFFSVWGSWIWP